MQLLEQSHHGTSVLSGDFVPTRVHDFAHRNPTLVETKQTLQSKQSLRPSSSAKKSAAEPQPVPALQRTCERPIL
ncbi:hypothetical protein M3J09_007808, partial [Ascochyta lentis]